MLNLIHNPSNIPAQESAETLTDVSSFFIQIIRVIAIIQVILIHVAAIILVDPNISSPGKLVWWIGDIIDSTARSAVPLFFMVSGMLLLNPLRIEEIQVFLRKRITRIGVPSIFWSLFYAFWLHSNHFSALVEDWPGLAKELVKALLGVPIYYHLWFMYVILALYLVTPLLRLYILSSDKNNRIYFVIIWFIATSSFSISRTVGVYSVVDIGTFTGYIGYFSLGYILHDILLNKRQFMIVIAAFISSVVFTIYSTYWFTINKHSQLETITYNYLYPNIIVMSICLFLLLRTIFNSNRVRFPMVIRKSIKLISNLSFGIYFVHVAVLEILFTATFPNQMSVIDQIKQNPILGMLALAFTVLFVSTIIIGGLRKIPVIKDIAG